MFKKLLCIGMLLVALTTKAHQTDISTTMLVEKENNSWVLQISASLTAFQQEIRLHYADTPYKTPEEFKQMVLDHLKKNVSFVFNGSNTITLSNGFVQLGHETKVVFTVEGVPAKQTKLLVKNTAFTDVYKSKSALVILKKGFTKERFVLNEANKHRLELRAQDTNFVLSTTQEASIFSYQNLFVILCITGIGFMVKRVFVAKENEEVEDHKLRRLK
ncbi:DUF6702 family protein [Cellulophaga fucicola]|uniref:Uncharacterized protein n=1 Tax=Cellulophaga fucicola TaxID=76595 RepID=A0A1K1MCK5_9FLAO|nr:DUF6702 family protein [Cellulophaga fucicola]SFW20868.1 hypothetical protein SAMN05660313_00512 [Cellulophaga fucicola]